LGHSRGQKRSKSEKRRKRSCDTRASTPSHPPEGHKAIERHLFDQFRFHRGTGHDPSKKNYGPKSADRSAVRQKIDSSHPSTTPTNPKIRIETFEDKWPQSMIYGENQHNNLFTTRVPLAKNRSTPFEWVNSFSSDDRTFHSQFKYHVKLIITRFFIVKNGNLNIENVPKPHVKLIFTVEKPDKLMRIGKLESPKSSSKLEKITETTH